MTESVSGTLSASKIAMTSWLQSLSPRFNAADAFVRECGIPLTPIGTVGEGRGARFLLDGREIGLKGFNHFG